MPNMTPKELKEAFRNQTPVVYQNVEYAYISALIHRLVGGEIRIQCELMDKSRRSITIAQSDRIEKTQEKTA